MKVKLYMCGGERPVSQYPLGLGYLKSNVIGHDIEIVSTSDELKDCDVIGLSTQAWGVAEAYKIRQSTDIPIVVGGQGTLWSKIKNLGFEWVVRGAGEKVLQDILDGKLDHGVVDGVVDLDKLEYPERGSCSGRIPILSARGCPYKCRFCSSQVFWNGVQFHSAEYFIAESKYLGERYKGGMLYILDDLFIANKKRFDQIHEMWMKEGLNKRWQLNSFVRANMFTKEIGLKMKEMGFRVVRFGAESGSNQVLKHLNKAATVEDNQRTIDIANEIRMPVEASFMHHLPGETEEDTQATKDFIAINKGKMTVRGFYHFKAFPGTDFYDGEDLLSVDMRVR